MLKTKRRALLGLLTAALASAVVAAIAVPANSLPLDDYFVAIDKGSAAGIQTGFKGQVLQGASGEDPLDGGDFTVVQVIGPNKCLAKTGLQSIGKNTRVVITLGK